MAIWTNYPSKTTPADNDSVLEYDATGRALKQTPFSGIYNWLQSKIHGLTASTADLAPSTDKLLLDKNGTLSRIDYSILAKAIIEQYNSSTLGGSAQSLQSAINALNSNFGYYLGSVGTLAELESAISNYGNSMPVRTSRVISLYASSPFSIFASNVYVGTMTRSGSDRFQVVLNSNGSNDKLIGANGSSGWTWEKQPTRAEVDALNTLQFGEVTFNTDNVTGSATGKWWCKIGKIVVASIEYTALDGKIANGNVICSGLPMMDYRLPVYLQSGGIQLRVVNGNNTCNLIFYYPVVTSDTSRHEVLITYVAT